MRYLLVQTEDGYCEYPVTEDKEYLKENEWQIHEGKRIFCLGGERYIFERGENVAVSSGEEAVLRIHGLKSRLYIRRMQVFIEAADREQLYLDQRKAEMGEAVLYPGSVLFLHNIKLEIWEDLIAVQGSPHAYTTALMPCSRPQMPDGYPCYKRSPRLIRKAPAKKILLELPKERERPGRSGILMTILPPAAMAAVAVTVGLLAGRGIYLLMSAAAAGLTAVFSVIKYLDEKKEVRERNRKRKERYLAYLWQKQKEIASAWEEEREVYTHQYPDIKTIAKMVRECDSRIYERTSSDYDFLTVLIGRYTGSPQFSIEGKEPAWDAGEDRLTEAAMKIRRRYSVIDRRKEINLGKAHLGMVGEREAIRRQMQILTARTAFSHSYHDLRMIIIYNKEYEEKFQWMRWLPHVRLPELNVLGMVSSERTRDLVLGSISRILKERAEGLKEGKQDYRYLPHYLFLIDEPFWVTDHGIMEYLRMDGTALGVSVIYTSDVRANLPAYIGTVLQLESLKEGTLLLEAGIYRGQRLRLYQSQYTDFEWLARDLGVVEHRQEITSYIPRSVTFFEMYGVEDPGELEIGRRWRESQSHRSLAVPVGMRSADEAFILNLHEKAHGPHGVIAGTTGSGKSELIQSYILSLAVNFHPYEVGFLLIDYKGGGMADLLGSLPHHMGTITNLDGAGSMRALVSVKAELSRRQQIFRSFQVNHINGYMRLFKEGTADEPIPHLFVISDEFAELKKEQPDFMKELISAARIGRSLGVHLILATQKPAGVVDEQILSNSRFRICLKVQHALDSKEILGTPDAADITLPGRAYIQVGNHEVYELFQSAMSGAAYQEASGQEAREDDRIYVVNELGQGELVNQDLSGRTEEYQICRTQLEAVVSHIREVFGAEGRAEVKKPWLRPLGKMLISPYVTDDSLQMGTHILWKAVSGQSAGEEVKNGGSDVYGVSLGKIDIPERQEQKELEHSFIREGNLLFTASAGFGKTVFLTTVLVSLAIFHDVDQLNYYILDYGNNGCMPLKELPHTAEYIALDDKERYCKFKKLISREITERKRAFARYAVPSWEAYQELSGEFLKVILIAIDQFDVVKEMGIEEEEFYTKLTRDGPGLGIYMAASANRVNAIRLATLNNFKKKIAGYHFDENETFQTVGRTTSRQTDIKGRVLVSGEQVHEAQIYMMAPGRERAAYSKQLKELIQKIRRKYPRREAPHIPVLPQEFTSSMLGKYADDMNCFLVGLEVEEVTAKGFDRTAGLFVIVGNTGSGKTNMLRVLAAQAAARGRICLFDSGSMELYAYRHMPDVLYVEGRKETGRFLEEMSEEIQNRRQFLKQRMNECPGQSPRSLISETPYYTVAIDDLEDFTAFMGTDLEQAALLIKEGIAVGITCILTVHAVKSRSMSAMDKMVRQAANGLVLSEQGVVPVFPVPGIRQLPVFGEGLLFRNGTYQRVRLPRYEA